MPGRKKTIAPEPATEPAQPAPKRRRGPYTGRAPRNYTQEEADKERAAMLAEFDARAAQAEERMDKVQKRLSVW